MSDINEEELKKNVQDKGTWLRFVFLILFGIALYFIMVVVFLGSLVQFLAKLFSGSVLSSLSEFGGNLAKYQAQVTGYLTFASDEKPFPFAPFPCCGKKDDKCLEKPSCSCENKNSNEKDDSED